MFPVSPGKVASLTAAVYEFLYTSVGQAIAAYAPNGYFAAIMNPLIIGAGMVSFAGVLVPWSQLEPPWKYFTYWIDPFNYLMGGLLGTVIWDVEVKCKPHEFTSFDPPGGQTCGEYMAEFFSVNAGYVDNGNATEGCMYCPYKSGAEYAKTFNLNEEYYGWRDVSCHCTKHGQIPLANRCHRLESRRYSVLRRMRLCS